jgi:hypothetical protein
MGDTLEKKKPKEKSQNEKARNMCVWGWGVELAKSREQIFFLQNGKRSWTRKKERQLEEKKSR